MNIFKILSSGDGSIKEPNISAFLGYLLDPNKEHGLKDFLLKSIIEPLVRESNVSSLIINENIVNLTNESNFSVNVELEKKVKIKSNKDRYIDIVISIYKEKELVFIICIENKIRDASITINQLNEQLEGIRTEYHNTPIGFIYLTPTSSDKSKNEYKEFIIINPNIPAHHLLWNSEEDELSTSIYRLLVDMLNDESKGLIEPIFEYSKYTIKAFLNFIKTDFQSYKEEKSNINKKLNYKRPVREYIKEIYSNLEYEKQLSVNDLKNKIVTLINQESGLDINKATLSAQVYMSIVNEKNRLHYNVNKTNHETFDLFYYIDDTRKIIKKFNKENLKDIDIIYIQ
jgi:hypothetical protein